MSTRALVAERKLTKYFRGPNQRIDGPLNIAMRVMIRSDASRIFQALTQAEYLETWITIPGDHADSHMEACQTGRGFRLDHYREGQQRLGIDCQYRIRRRRKLLFTWKATGHESECRWQQELWSKSLDRLNRLFAS
jgi:uncharacterized protein YndB with AHSA1/START domain